MRETNAPMPIVRDLVLVGGGHSHLFVLKNLGMNPILGVQVTLIAKDTETPYSGMLPGYILGYYTKEEIHIDLNVLTRFAGARLIHASAVGLSRDNRLVHCNDGRPPLRYDVCSLDVGCVPKFIPEKSPAMFNHVTPVKPINGFCIKWERIIERIRTDLSHGITDIVVVGSGAAGIELILSMQNRIQRELQSTNQHEGDITFSIISKNPFLMPSRGSKVQQNFSNLLRLRKVNIYFGSGAIDAVENESDTGGNLILENGNLVPFSEAFWCTSSDAPGWLSSTDLDLSSNGFIQVRSTLQSQCDNHVFASGDCANMIESPRPKAGVFAVRQGPPLAYNICALIEGRRLKSFKPQWRYLSLLAIGNDRAVALYGNTLAESTWAWRWKKRIDQNWIKSYQQLEMNSPKKRAILPNQQHLPLLPKLPLAYKEAGVDGIKLFDGARSRCGGCGSKVDNCVLKEVIHSIQIASAKPISNDSLSLEVEEDDKNFEVLIGLDDADDAAVVLPPRRKDVAMVHTVDFFRAHITDPYTFGKIAANHALSDAHAMGANPCTALAIAVVPYAAQDMMANSLIQLMTGAVEIFKEAKCELVGGHTSEGAELALGFSVNATIPLKEMLRKGGMQTGDRIILTKAIGTGAILAADMHGRCKACWLEGAIKSMLQSSKGASELLLKYQATSATDVTGFGLAGHLLEMVRATNLNQCTSANIIAYLDLDCLPILAGAIPCVTAGDTSSLHPSNQKAYVDSITPFDALSATIEAAKITQNLSQTPESSPTQNALCALYSLLFDPQTAGGLLATLPGDQAEECLVELKAKGYTSSAIIGQVAESNSIDSSMFYRIDEHKEIICRWATFDNNF